MGVPVVGIRWTKIKGRRCLLIEFNGELTREGAVRGGDAMKAQVTAASEPVTIVWDCRNMDNYTVKAFEAWRQRLSAIAGQVDQIHCVTASTFIKLGASALGLPISKSIKTAPSFEDLSF
jgi:hypothetical protein